MLSGAEARMRGSWLRCATSGGRVAHVLVAGRLHCALVKWTLYKKCCDIVCVLAAPLCFLSSSVSAGSPGIWDPVGDQ